MEAVGYDCQAGSELQISEQSKLIRLTSFSLRGAIGTNA